ncbi:hypothetical protein EGH25_00785 [Haladaptatus sp. F3-133]|jgi:hypothetical protein|uniref:DUF7124 domain-containing protein n=1 Tax=Halorutilus salinus TaxID=2487751 RepID=A0A9Q4GHK8_9EURY|nr:hypothetical protein [Halorutilus salinus]MCX2817898.1 hypothetical protein [Halorutilus salinus]
MDLDGDVNLAVAYEGIADLEDTGFALNDLKLRVDELGIVGNVESHVANDLGREHDVHVDFHSVPPGKKNGLIRGRSTDPDGDARHVFLGTTKRDEVLAEKMGWEYHDISEVAEEEGWE